MKETYAVEGMIPDGQRLGEEPQTGDLLFEPIHLCYDSLNEALAAAYVLHVGDSYLDIVYQTTDNIVYCYPVDDFYEVLKKLDWSPAEDYVYGVGVENHDNPIHFGANTENEMWAMVDAAHVKFGGSIYHTEPMDFPTQN